MTTIPKKEYIYTLPSFGLTGEQTENHTSRSAVSTGWTPLEERRQPCFDDSLQDGRSMQDKQQTACMNALL